MIRHWHSQAVSSLLWALFLASIGCDDDHLSAARSKDAAEHDAVEASSDAGTDGGTEAGRDGASGASATEDAGTGIAADASADADRSTEAALGEGDASAPTAGNAMDASSRDADARGADALDADTGAALDATQVSPFDSGSAADARLEAATPDAERPPLPTGRNILQLTFSPMYSAHDGTHLFELPVKVVGASGALRVNSWPVDCVSSRPTRYGVLLTILRPGDTTLTIADAAGDFARAELHISAAGPADYEAGKTYYLHGRAEAADPSSPGGVRSAVPACASCHQGDAIDGGVGLGAGAVLPSDAEHTPMQTAGHSDEELIKLFTQGVKPAGAPFRRLIGPEPAVSAFFRDRHRWLFEEAAAKQLLVYLRGLEPRSRGALDFGGLLPSRGPRTP